MDTNIGRNRLSERIEESLLNAIRVGEFPAGSSLPSERSLMEMFDVGRPSVKEALLMLERKGFVRLTTICLGIFQIRCVFLFDPRLWN